MSILGVNSNTFSSVGSFYEKGITDIFSKIRSVVRSILASISRPTITEQKRIMTKMLNGLDVINFATAKTDETTFVDEFLSLSAIKNADDKRKTVSDILDQALGSKKLVFIPFVLEGTIRNHIVIIALDRDTKTVEYYNSQARDIEEESRKLVGCDIRFDEFLDLIKVKCPDWVIKSNQTKHQKDLINCGAYVCWFIEQRKNRSFEEISATPHQKIDITAMRTKIAGITQSNLGEPTTSTVEEIPEDLFLILNE